MNKVNINYFKKILLLVLIFFSALFSFSYAHGGDPAKDMKKPQVMLEELPGLTNNDMVARFEASGSDGFIYYLRWIIRISIALGSIVAVSTLIFGGFLYITTDNFLKKGQGKEMIQNSLMGLLLLLMSYVLLGQINSNLLEVKFNPVKIKVDKQDDNVGQPIRTYNARGLSIDDFEDRYLPDDYEKVKCFSHKITRKNQSFKNSEQLFVITPEEEEKCAKELKKIESIAKGTKIGICVKINVEDKKGTQICAYKPED